MERAPALRENAFWFYIPDRTERDSPGRVRQDERMKQFSKEAEGRPKGAVEPGGRESGKIYKKIVAVAEEVEADIIVMGTHGISGFQDFLVGSNTYRVVMSSPCPVISVQAHSKKIGFKDIVLPIDNSHSSRQKVKHAVEIARHYNSVVHIAGLMTMTDVDMQRRFEVKIHQVQNYLEEHEVAHSVKIFKTDNSPSVTLEYSNQINADLMIIMTDQESSGFFMGNYAQQLINQSKIPVMSIRPDEGDPEKISLGY